MIGINSATTARSADACDVCLLVCVAATLIDQLLQLLNRDANTTLPAGGVARWHDKEFKSILRVMQRDVAAAQCAGQRAVVRRRALRWASVELSRMRNGLPRSAQEFAHGQPRHDAYCFDRELEWRQLLNQLPSVTFDDAIRNVAERLWTKAANASRRPPPARAVANALHGAWRPKVPNILKRPSASRSGPDNTIDSS